VGKLQKNFDLTRNDPVVNMISVLSFYVCCLEEGNDQMHCLSPYVLVASG